MTVLLCLGAAGCGRSADVSLPTGMSTSASTAVGHTATASPTASHGHLNDGDNDTIGDADEDNGRDNDRDNSEDRVVDDNRNYHDSDDRDIVAYGRPANAADKRAITGVTERYYALSAADDGARACGMLIPRFAESVAESYGRGSTGPAYLRSATTCPQVLALQFRHAHTQVAAPFAVTGVRVLENHAYALLGSRVTAAAYIQLERRRGFWKIGALTGSTLP
jgi:hypothetical protein